MERDIKIYKIYKGPILKVEERSQISFHLKKVQGWGHQVDWEGIYLNNSHKKEGCYQE